MSVPSGIHISAGEYVSLEMDVDRPYLYHSDVEKRYPPGQLKQKGKGNGNKWDCFEFTSGKEIRNRGSLPNYPFGNQNMFSRPNPSQGQFGVKITEARLSFKVLMKEGEAELEMAIPSFFTLHISISNPDLKFLSLSNGL